MLIESTSEMLLGIQGRLDELRERETVPLNFDKGVIPMPERVIAEAEKHIGWKENNGDNFNPFAAFLDTLPGFYNGIKNGYAWCDIFVDYCFVKAYGADMAKKLINHNDCGAGCIFSAKAYREMNRFDKNPKVGDQVFFGAAGCETHTGIVVDVTDDYVITIEGNTSDAVKRRQYPKNYSFAGFGHPRYELLVSDAEREEIEELNAEPKAPEASSAEIYPTLCEGDTGSWVSVMQAMLEALGYSVGRSGIDGEFGPDTAEALIDFEFDMDLPVSNVCNAAIWELLKAGGRT